jgi:6,7-dimethyl-8-ribityllumazine synthase
MGERGEATAALDAAGMRFGVAVARYNAEVTERLLDSAERTLRAHGAADVTVVRAPGAFELPLVARRLAATGVDAVICLGAVIRGETPHFEHVAGECARGIGRVALDADLPVVFGVLTTDDRAQALERTGGRAGDKGAEAAMAAIEMVSALRALR